MGQPTRLLYVVVILAVCIIFYLTGPFTSGTNSPDKTSNAEARLSRWLDVVAPPKYTPSRPSRAYDPPVHAPVFEKVKPLVPFSPFPLGKPSASAQRPLSHQTGADFNDVQFSFQEELSMRWPRGDLRRFKDYRAHNFHPEEIRPTFATFLSTRNASLQDPYFTAALSLTYRFLWAPKTSSKEYPFTVFVAPFIAREQRETLEGAGANVRELQTIDWEPNADGVPARLRDTFTKLHMWQMTEFPRIAYMDADAFPVKQIDEVFEVAEPQTCVQSELTEEESRNKEDLCDYVFAGVPDMGGGRGVNGGFLVLQPSKVMYGRLMGNLKRADHYDNYFADQGFLNWQFGSKGPFPARLLPRKYNGIYPQASDEGKLSVVHHKIWDHDFEDAPWLAKNWNATWGEMVTFFDSTTFSQARQADGLDGSKKIGAPATGDKAAFTPGIKRATESGSGSGALVDEPVQGVDNSRNTALSGGTAAKERAREELAAHGLSPKQQAMLERHQNGKLPMNHVP